jgi:agmatine/peptidylarginine deiminase
MVAEWEPAAGTLIRWPLGIPSSLVVELAKDDTLYVLVETQSQENSARNTFASWGVNANHVRYVRANTYSHWTRDWGPHDVFDGNGVWGITDPIFNGYPWVPGCDRSLGEEEPASERIGSRGYDEDDQVNAALAAFFGAPLHALPRFCTGGNIMTDGQGTAFSTRQMVDENAPLGNEASFLSLAEEYLGITRYFILDNPEIHGIQHIDCYAKLLDEETVLVKRVSPSHGEYACVEALADAFEGATGCYGRPYRVRRVDCGAYNSYGDPAAYTNSLILNGKVLVPLFGISTDAAALAAYEAAMPGYEVIGFSWGSWYYYDALHCRTMGIHDRHMLRMTHRRMDETVPWASSHEMRAFIDDRSGAGLVEGGSVLRWRLQGETLWNEVPLAPTADPDTFAAAVPEVPGGATVEYWLEASDSSGRVERLPRAAPLGWYDFEVEIPVLVSGGEAIPGMLRAAASPNPFRGETTIRLARPAPGGSSARVYDLLGRRIRTLPMGGAPGEWVWNGKDDGGREVPPGVYFIRVGNGESDATIRCVRFR